MVTPPKTSSESTPRRRGRPPAGRALLTSDEVVAATIRAIRKHGPLVSMDEIAAETGFTKPIIYRALGDKEAIAWAVSDHLVGEVDRETVQAIADLPRSGDTLRISVHSYFELIQRDRDILLFVENAWGGSDGTHLDRLIERSADLYIAGFTDSPATNDQPDWRRRTWALATVGVLRVTARIWTADPYCTLDEIVDDVVTIILNSHRRPPNPPAGRT